MSNVEEMQSRFGSENVNFFTGPGGFTAVKLTNSFGEAVMTLHGAHVMSYTPSGEKPVLWMSEKSMFAPGEPIRGGIPVCWPWFGADPAGKFGGHGYARLSLWNVTAVNKDAQGAISIVLALCNKMVDEKFAPQDFKLELTVTLGKALAVYLKVCNCGSEKLAYSGALHSYFSVADSASVKVEGLAGCEYSDKVINVEGLQQSDIVIDREIDRVYRNTTGTVRIVDPVWNRVIRVEKSGSNSTVVWNPWVEKSKKMPDFGDEEYHTMICVEAANATAAGDDRVLEPGAEAVLSQTISLE